MLIGPWVKCGHDYYTIVCKCRLYISLEKCDTLVITHQHQSTTYRPQHVGEVTLEEPFHSFILHDLLPTVHSSPESVGKCIIFVKFQIAVSYLYIFSCSPLIIMSLLLTVSKG